MLQVSRHVELSVLATYSTGLSWTVDNLTVMPSTGNIVIPEMGATGTLRVLRLKAFPL